MNLALKNVKLAVIYGFFIWLIPFVLTILIYPIHEQDRPFFESIMPVVLAGATVYFAVRYSKINEIDTTSEGLFLGIMWMLISVVIDFPLFSYGPMKMPFVSYWKDIGFTYLLIPIITSGIGAIIASYKTSSLK
jgi:hypothetical protein